MDTIFSLFQLLVFHSLISLIHAPFNSYPLNRSKQISWGAALVFNPYNKQIYNYLDKNPKSNSEPKMNLLLAACPAEKKSEMEWNKSKSKDHKALFVRTSYATEVKLEDVIRCKKNFEMAAATFIPDQSYIFTYMEFGYEIYFQESDIPVNVTIKTTPYEKYEKISSYESEKISSDESETISSDESETIPIPSSGNPNPLNFMWLSKIAFEYNDYLWSLRNVTYTIHRKADKLNVKCDNYDLGKEFYEGFDINKYYSIENLKKVLGDVIIPEESTRQLKSYGRVEKYNLLMPYHFQPTDLSVVSCSDLTSVPIWHEVSKDLLDYSERFLTAISQITKKKLTVISGSYDILSLPYKIKDSVRGSSKTINLTGFGIGFMPVPKIIFKIVRYQSYDCNDNIYECWFDMVIVIHNQPEFTALDKLCPTDHCEDWGWESIQYMNTSRNGEKSKYIYCCRMTYNMESRLRLNLNTYHTEDLNLKKFPVHKEGKDENDYINMQEEFHKQMDKWAPTKLEEELKSQDGS